jgi:hypothetical protein
LTIESSAHKLMKPHIKSRATRGLIRTENFRWIVELHKVHVRILLAGLRFLRGSPYHREQRSARSSMQLTAKVLSAGVPNKSGV